MRVPDAHIGQRLAALKQMVNGLDLVLTRKPLVLER
jgi:hypothetical protein